MKLAVSGSHNTGKTTLIGDLAEAMPEFAFVDEPYQQLLDEGHVFADLPGHDDFELQLERSIRSVSESEGNTFFDRCPYDIIAYLHALDGSPGFDQNKWLHRVKAAIEDIDLVIFVPIEEPDRMPVPAEEYSDLRRRVDGVLREIVLEDRYNFDVPAIEVSGSPGDRVRQVLEALEIK